MGHRHLFNASQMFENDHESWNANAENPYVHSARSNTVENGSFFYSREHMSSSGVHFTSPWNAQTRSNGFTTMSHNELQQPCHPDTPGPSQGPYMQPSNVVAVSENYYPNTTSSNYERHTPHGIEGGFTDIAMDGRRVQQKRKSPGMPVVCESGNNGIYYSGGTSSDVPIYPEFSQEITNVDAQHNHWDHVAATPGYRGNSLSIRGESSMRNVRSRSELDLETNVSRSYLPDNNTHNTWIANHAIEHSGAVDFSSQSFSNPNPIPLTTDWSPAEMSPAHGRIVFSDPHGFSHESNHFAVGSSSGNSRVEMGGYDFNSSRYPQVFHGSSSHTVRGPRNSYSQRSSPSFRSSTSSRLGNAGPSEEGLQSVVESYSRHPRPLPSTGWRNTDRSRRSRISNERYSRSYPDGACAQDRMAYEGFMMMERPSRSSMDQHRDLRLDIDNMSYEELLALGERIGTVNTGLSNDSISKCLRETIHCASDQIQDEERCVICLEEYKDMDDVGMLKGCGHDFHVDCVKQWLSMKNLCPICKAAALGGE